MGQYRPETVRPGEEVDLTVQQRNSISSGFKALTTQLWISLTFTAQTDRDVRGDSVSPRL